MCVVIYQIIYGRAQVFGECEGVIHVFSITPLSDDSSTPAGPRIVSVELPCLCWISFDEHSLKTFNFAL